MSAQPVADATSVDGRREQVARAVRSWSDQLVDLSGRNQLLYHRLLRTGSLDLAAASPPSVAALLGELPVRLSQLFPSEEGGRDAVRRARAIHDKARAYFEERGIATLLLAVGMATWTPTSSSATPAAPVLLRPLRLEPRGAARADFDVSLHGDWQINGTLLHLLATEFGVDIAADELLAELDTEGDLDPAPLLDRLRRVAADVPDLAVTDATVAGTFAYTKLPMVTDLTSHVDELARHDLIAALAGVEGAQQALREVRARDADPRRPEATAPDEEFLVLDADASQHTAITAALDGQPLIIQGPPGTGKSQTIANLIAALAARGRRVLFVAEKRAAIEAVTGRLDRAGLGDLVMDLHGGATSKRRLADELGATIEQLGRVPATDHTGLHHELTTSREALASHVEAMHEVRRPWGLSMFAVTERLIGLPPDAETTLRFAGPHLEALDADAHRRAHEAITEWATLSEPVVSQRSPWAGATVATREEARAALELVVELDHRTVKAVQRHLDRIVADTDLPGPPTISTWHQPLVVLRGVATTLELFDPAVFDLDLDRAITALAPATGGLARRATAGLFDRDYRAARQQLRDLWCGDDGAPVAELRAAAMAARDQLAEWRRLGGTAPPTPPHDLDEAVGLYDTLLRQLEELNGHLGRRDLTVRPLDRIGADVAALVADQITLFRLPRIAELQGWLVDHHLEGLLRMVVEGDVEPDHVTAVLDHAWLQSIRQTVTAQDPRLASFDGGLLHDHARRFREADRRHLEVAAARVRRAVAEHATKVRDRHGDQDDLVARQVRRRRGLLPLRALFEQAPDVLTALRPCWAMSPLAVSQTLPPEQLFDVVIFDEASQVPPADAVPALLRAPQAVIAGDRRQLPPTTFFDATVDDEVVEDDGGLTVGFESILDVLDTVLRSYLLTWHYRSREEPLIAFANHHLYDDRLITFPGAVADDCLRLERVEPAGSPDGRVDTRSNDAEVARVVDLVLDHARNRPDESLGVIALGQHHAARVEAALRDQLAALGDRVLERFFDDAAPERAFVKNLERVQGDERDATILTIGYGPSVDGRLRYRFGPLLTEGGERRLNVAITRARRRMTVVSSFSHVDMDPDRMTAPGMALLRRYLRYAAAGGTALEDVDVEHDAPPLAADIVEHLEHAGLRAAPRYGSSALRIDVALVHPSDPDRMVLAVESDGPGYAATPTTRDRERLRREVLERLGWRHLRVWSSDWAADAVAQTRRITEAYDEACRELAAGDRVPLPDEGDDAGARVPPPVTGTPAREGRRPVVRPGAPITQYTHAELVALVRWVTSDTLLRTEDQLLDELMHELGFQRRGPRIVEALTTAIRTAADPALRGAPPSV